MARKFSLPGWRLAARPRPRRTSVCVGLSVMLMLNCTLKNNWGGVVLSLFIVKIMRVLEDDGRWRSTRSRWMRGVKDDRRGGRSFDGCLTILFLLNRYDQVGVSRQNSFAFASSTNSLIYNSIFTITTPHSQETVTCAQMGVHMITEVMRGRSK